MTSVLALAFVLAVGGFLYGLLFNGICVTIMDQPAFPIRGWKFWATGVSIYVMRLITGIIAVYLGLVSGQTPIFP